jgi:UDP-glucose 4-epimerase
MNNVGITGPTGFLGRNILKSLQSKKNKLIPFEGNLLSQKDLDKFFKENKIDQLIHLAGTFLPPFENLIEKNLLTTEKLLEQAVRANVKKIILASSGAVYGEPLAKESFEFDPFNPNTLYGLSKMYAEECCKYYQQNNNIECIILRFSSIYGPDNNKGVIFNFLEAIKRNKKVIIYGDGKQTRDFLHVEDACSAIEKTLNYNKSDIFNISSSLRFSINDIVKFLKTKYNFEIEYREKENNLESLCLNIDKARSKLGFVPKVTELRIS